MPVTETYEQGAMFSLSGIGDDIIARCGSCAVIAFVLSREDAQGWAVEHKCDNRSIKA